jgi:CheY-like chemotaxis protein
VHFVEDGVRALESVTSSRPDLVVLDINMPVMDGLETLRRLRSSAATKDLPVVVFSTGREEQAVQATKKLGVLDYIQKPFHYNDFTTAVARILALAKSDKAPKPAKAKKAH